MCEEAPIGVSRAVTAGGGTCRPLCLEGLPVEGGPVKEPLLLSAGRQRTAICTAVRGVLSADVTQTVTARHWTSAERGEEEEDTGRGKRRETEREEAQRSDDEE